MTDTWDELIGDIELRNFQMANAGNKGKYDFAKENRESARTALRAAIDAVVKENEELTGRLAAYKVDYPIAVNDIAALEAQLAEADADAERLDEMLGEMVDVHGKSYGDVQDARDLHVARLSKRGQG